MYDDRIKPGFRCCLKHNDRVSQSSGKRRFVKKIKDSKDHRIVWVNLARRGLRIIQEINKKKQKHISSILEKLTQHERQILIDILKRISQTAGEAEINSLRI